MSVLRDIIDVGKEFNFNKLNLKNQKSISREANRGVLQFTAGASSSIPLEHVTLVTKALEKHYTSFVVVMTSIDSVTDERSIRDYIGKIHQNDNFSIFRDESTTFNAFPIKLRKLRPLMESSSETSEEFINQYLESRNDADYEIVDYDNLQESQSIANGILNSKKREGNKIFKTGNAVTVLDEATNDWSQIFFVKDENDKLFLLESSMKTESTNLNINEEARKVAKENINLLENYVPDFDMSILNRKFQPTTFSVFGKPLSEADMPTAITDTSEFGTKMGKVIASNDKNQNVNKDVLRDNDVKKANELEPTLLHLKTFFRDADNGLHPVDYVIGVKVVIHKINSDSMINNIVKARKRGKAFFNLMKLTTGEISFFKDYVFAINKTKDSINTKYNDDPWWNAHERRRKYAKFLSKIRTPQQLVPNATIIISMDEAQIIKSEHSIDLMNISVIKDIMDQLFLLGFVIVDSSTEVAYFMFDGKNMYEEQSFASLERDNGNSAREVKNIMNVLGRM